MRTSYTKPNSYSQQSARQYCDAVKEVCALLNISIDEWRELMFETGYQWAIANAPDHQIAMAWLTDPNIGYWNEFLVDYINDDEWILGNTIGLLLPLELDYYLSAKSVYHTI